MRPIAFYLPQYHETEENNKWWGKGFTEWNSVKNAKPYFKGHYQPKTPLDNNYYDLSESNANTWKWQANLAREYGVYGFCIYHYWFKDCKKILEKPAEILLNHKDIDTKYFFCWANEPWKRTWYSYNQELLIDQEYGTEKEWIKHYEYLSSFFKDERYIKINNRPIIAIYRTAAIDELEKMKKIWNQLAIKDCFSGIHLMSGNTSFKRENRIDLIDSFYCFEPAFTLHYGIPKYLRLPSYIRRVLVSKINTVSDNKKIEDLQNLKTLYKYLSEKTFIDSKPEYPGICPSWDNTPRKKWKGTFFKKSSPLIFEKKLTDYNKTLEANDFLFINAWNEWSEGAYLEPDEINKYSYLEAIKNALEK